MLKGLNTDNLNKENDIVTAVVTSSQLSNCRGLQRRRQRRRICYTMPMITILIAILIAALSGTAATKESKWLQHRLRQLAAPHMDTFTPIRPVSSSFSSSSSSTTFAQDSDSASPLVVVATHEGQVWTIDSTDGSLLAGFSTGPPLLVLDGHYEEAAADGEESQPPTIPSGLSLSHIVPSLDGILYWRQPVTAADDSSDDAKEEGSTDPPKLVPIASIRDLVDNPIQMCHEVAGENCDILTATNLGPSLFSLNSQGSLNWARARGSSTALSTSYRHPLRSASDDNDSDSENNSEHGRSSTSSSSDAGKSKSTSSLLLQRQDYLVQQISIQTGEQVWNITWGSLEALDFAGQDEASSGSRRSHGSRYLPSGDTVASRLPSVIFGNDGRSLVAVSTQPPKFLWKRDFPSVVTNVLGVEQGSWQALSVVDEGDDTMEDASSQRRWSGLQKHPRLPGEEQPRFEQEKADSSWSWWWAGGGKAFGKQLKQDFAQQQLENGLVFIPKPDAEKLVRNSWYLNHFWDSPQSRGEQNFQRYIADHPHEDARFKQNLIPPQSKQVSYPYPTRELDSFYDTSNIPRLVLLPPSEHSNTELPSPQNTGGVFLSWSLVMAIITLLVGTAGAAYIIYGQKKQKWLAKNTGDRNSSNSNGAPDLTATSLSMPDGFVRGRSISTGSYNDPNSTFRPSSHSEEAVVNSDGSRHLAKDLSSQLPTGKVVRAPPLNRSSSAPLMSRDVDESTFTSFTNESIVAGTAHSGGLSPNRRASSAIEEHKGWADAARGQLVKHKSAPVESPPEAPLGGVGMIDGIPLIRYSRYQSEFKEVEPLGKGGFGTVFRCSNVLDGRQYAVKKVSIRSSRDSNAPGTEAFSQELHRVLREVKFLALLDHPNIVRYYTAWLEMEEKDASTIADEKVNSKRLSRRYSSGLLTNLDPTNTNVGSYTTMGGGASKSTISKSHLKPKNATNPLGLNNDFGYFVEDSVSYRPKTTKPVLPSMEDCGFIFDDDDEDIDAENGPSINGNTQTYQDHSAAPSDYSRSEFSHSVSSSWDASYSTNKRNKQSLVESSINNRNTSSDQDGSPNKALRHTLYIQMQLCSSKTLADFLANAEARRGPIAARQSVSTGEGSVDVPYALRLFYQIVQAVHHVHQQGLIHRDLKPSNCFIDESGTVKVGDFGLSRESNDGSEKSGSRSVIVEDQESIESGDDNTVGVGTRSYSSPEQINGSDYDSKTDIYSLGVMLFELLYPMYTGMERTICFQKLRSNCTFPEAWKSIVSIPFPTLDGLVRSMLSHQPSYRPTAENITRHIQGLLEEYSITLSSNRHDGENENVIFLRVEAKPAPDVLKHAIQLIQDAATPKTIEIVQYGMRSSNKNSTSHQKRAVLEFALTSPDVEPGCLAAWGSSLTLKLEAHDEILVARHVWHHQEMPSY